MGGFPKLGVPFWGPHNKAYNILGSILGYPNFGKLPCLKAAVYLRLLWSRFSLVMVFSFPKILPEALNQEAVGRHWKPCKTCKY